MTEAKWYFLGPDKQPVGPYDQAGLAAFHAAGQLRVDALCWAEGQAEWLPLQDIPDLQAVLQPPVQLQTAGAQPQAVVAPAAIDPELAEFQAEIGAIEAETEQANRADTPPPDQQRFQDDDGTIYVWDSSMRRFVPAGETTSSTSYDVADMVYEAEDAKIPAMPAAIQEDEDGPTTSTAPGAEAQAAAQAAAAPAKEVGKEGGKGKKRSGEDIIEREKERSNKAKEEATRKAEWFELKQNTSVYVSGLPSDVTEEEVAQVFGKCGVIKEDDERRPRVKVYRDRESGMPKGDGLVTYLKDPSVELALNILDGAPFREDPKQVIHVQRAKFEQKGQDYVPKKKPKSKKKAAGVLSKQEKDLGWGGFDDKLAANKVTVILEHMFHPSEMEEEATLREDLEDDIKTECTKMGPVEKVRVFHMNPQGIVMVKFKTDEAAAKCIEVMEGRYFGGKRVSAHMWDGIANYHVKKQETAEEQQARLDKFAQQIEGKLPEDAASAG
ncbi:hypothetical protein ABBQ38_007186 [Trebouxia sp. C0009 RCD-2024]